MKILDTEKKFILVSSNQKQVFLVDSQNFSISYTKQFPSKTLIQAGSLQYGTGVAALCMGSIVHIYDFLYQRQIYTLETYKPILKVCIRKNLLIIVSEDRILIHNLEKRQNECYIQTLNGKLVIIQESYFNLSIFYPESHTVLVNKSIWSKGLHKMTSGVKYQKGTYFDKASKVVLALENVLSFYEQGQLVKVYGFDDKIAELSSMEDPSLVFVLLSNGQVIGQNLTQQFQYKLEEVKENQLSAIDAISQIYKKSQYIHFWLKSQWIYKWQKSQNQQQGKLYKANVKQGTKKKYEEIPLPTQKAQVQKQNVTESNENQSKQKLQQ